jgi:hypothetical protein
MNGYDLVKNIRTKYSFEELPVLVVSGTENTCMKQKRVEKIEFFLKTDILFLS